MVRRTMSWLVALLLAIALVPMALGAPASGLSNSVTIRVQITDFGGSPLQYGQIIVFNSDVDVVRELHLQSDGHVDVTLPRGDYYVYYSFTNTAQARWDQETPLLTFDADSTLNLAPIWHELTLDFTNQSGNGLAIDGLLHCSSPSSFGYPYGPVFRQRLILNNGHTTMRVPTWGASSTCALEEATTATGTRFGRVWDGRLSAYATTVAPAAQLTLAVQDGFGGAASSGYVTIADADPGQVTQVGGQLSGSGTASFQLEEGTWDISYQSYHASTGLFYKGTSQVVLDGDLTKDLAPPDPRSLTIDVVDDQTGSPVDAYLSISCQVLAADSGTLEVSQAAGGSSVTVWALDSGTGTPDCQVTVQANGRPIHVVAADAPSSTGNTLTVRLPETYTVNGTLSGGATGPLTSGGVSAQIETDAGLQGAGYANVDNGSFSLPLVDGRYRFTANGVTGDIDNYVVRTGSVDVTSASVLALQLDLVPLRLRVRNADGTPATSRAYLSCIRTGGSSPLVERQQTSVGRPTDDATLLLWGLSGVDASGRPGCSLTVENGYEPVVHRFSPAADGTTELTVVLGLGTVVDNSGPPADADGVPDTIEASAPNGGDGNNDGIVDYEQNNVTSVPGNGGDTDQPFVTIAGPAGTTLSTVSTLAIGDPSIGASPPPGVELPHGLAQFRLEGLAPGSTHVVSIFPSSTAGLTSYAKFHDGAWSTLPPSLVSITGSRVDITLTDGGIGDDDGVANGVIVDPGGPAVVTSTQPNDLALSAVADVTVNATTHNGAKVTFTKPVVTGSLPNNPSPACSKASGTTFPIGSTTVTCTVTDARYANSPVSRSFTVKVLGAAEQLAALRTSVIGVGSGKVLQTAVEKVQSKLAAGNNKTTCKALLEFGVVVAAQLLAKKITVSKAAALAATAVRIGTVLRC